MGRWLAESVDEIRDPYHKARFEAGYAVLKDNFGEESKDAEPDQPSART